MPTCPNNCDHPWRLTYPGEYEPEVLDRVNEQLGNKSEMSFSERRFLSGLIRLLRPSRLLEIGIASGGSSVIMLNAIADIPGSCLYSVDYSVQAYKYPNKPVGFMVRQVLPTLSDRWRLHAGGTFAAFAEQFHPDIDFCLLDSSHSLPGECLDFLMVYPFLRQGAVIVIHDIQLHYLRMLQKKPIKGTVAGCLLFNTLHADKLIASSVEHPVGNIGAIRLNAATPESINSLFNILTLPWNYIPMEKDIDEISRLFANYYSQEKNMQFLNIVKTQRDYLQIAQRG